MQGMVTRMPVRFNVAMITAHKFHVNYEESITNEEKKKKIQ